MIALSTTEWIMVSMLPLAFAVLIAGYTSRQPEL
jgi:hypothetical protein